MSSDAAVVVDGLSKAYTISHATERHSTLGSAIMHRVRRPIVARSRETFWALSDVSFRIDSGDVVGVIGRNGAGKSTLLKVLSRITEPTRGAVDLYGRVGSLLEVGTGFHPEFTGRENVFLNGTILGMSRREVRAKFDEIVAFAGVEQFLDTPVKRYSSGMHLRLAFAVAAHLEPEILLVDEVLAVGDAEFQAKCLGKMKDVAASGRTVFFVSHNLGAVRELCSRGLVLHKGEVVCDGTVDDCLRIYSADARYRTGGHWTRTLDVTRPLTIESVDVTLTGDQPTHRLAVDVRFATNSPHRPAFVALEILDAGGIAIMQPLPTVQGFIRDDVRTHEVRLDVDLPPLIPGSYLVTVWAGTHNTETLDEVKGCVGFEVQASPTRNRTYPHTPDHGYVVPHTTVEYHPQSPAGTPDR
ncbi:ABC transporter ATP-binding protein [Gemmatimonadetes bacterium T265]|nr:ABC transporter ATP-binding protein [Gemmatimonadetes bacterium T265]